MSAAILVVAAAMWLATLPVARQWAGLKAPDQAGPGTTAPAKAARVIAAPPRPVTMERTVTAIGTVRSANAVVLKSETAGRLAQLLVAPGTHVDRGAAIAVIEDESAAIALQQAELQAEDAARALDRIERLASSGSVTDRDRDAAQSAKRAADLSVRAARLEFDRHHISAPISGWLGLIEPGAGDYLAAGDHITTIEDRATLLVDFRLPQAAAASLAPGDRLEVLPLSGTGADPALSAEVTAIDNHVDAASRTIAAEARLQGAPDRLRPGMALRLTLRQAAGDFPAIDPLALQWGADGAFVWVLRAGKAQRLPVTVAQRRADLVLVTADFQPADLVVSAGILQLRPGLPAEAVGAVQGDG